MKLIRIATVPQSLRTLLKGQLRFMSEQGFDVLAVSSDGSCFEEMLQEQGVRGVRVNMTRQITPFRDLIALIRLVVLFLKERPDIVHTHTPKAGTLGMMAAWITHVPVRLHTVAGLPLLVATGKKRRILEWVEYLTYACATRVYPNSFVMKDIILDLNLTKEKKLKVIGNGSSNGIDTQYFSPTGDFKHLVKKEGVFTFCFVGRMVKDKGINELIQAFVQLYKDGFSVRLLLVGAYEENLDPLRSETVRFIQNHPAIEHVGFQKDVRPYFAISDALVFPSYREGFPNVVMQAGAMGLSSIVTDINGCNEIIVPHENGELVPPRDADALYRKMKEWAAHPDEVRVMAAKARGMVASRFEQKDVWRELRRVYEEESAKG